MQSSTDQLFDKFYDVLLLGQTIYKNKGRNRFYCNKKVKKQVKKIELVKILQYSPSLAFFFVEEKVLF